MAGLLACATLLGLALTPSPSRSQTVALESFAGTWVFSGGRSDLQGLDDAVNRVADQMNLFIREIARGEIHRRINHEQRVQIGVPGPDRITLGMDGWGPVEIPVGGRAAQVRGPEGNQVRITASFRDGRLVQRTSSDQGSRVNAFSLSGDGGRLTMAVSISAGQLPADIRYRLSYRRAR